MRIWAWGTVAFSAFSIAVAACGGSGGSGNTGGDTGMGGQSASISSSSSSGSVTTGSSSSSSGSMDCGSLQFSSDATCQDCATTNCCAELAACDTGTDCDTVLACLNACDPNDMTCLQGCVDANPTGYSDLNALVSCVAPDGGGGACDTECGNMAMGICDSGLTSNIAACDTCLGTNCCTEYDACVADANCKACLTGGGTQCDTDTLFQATVTCHDGQCDAECNAGKICDSGLVDNANPTCGTCLGTNCCDEFTACAADQACLDCITGMTTTGCDTNALLMAADSCQTNKCNTDCM